jgi:hypothetical protein
LDTQTAEPLRAELNRNPDAQTRTGDTIDETPAQTPCQNAAPPVNRTFPYVNSPAGRQSRPALSQTLRYRRRHMYQTMQKQNSQRIKPPNPN